MAEGSERRGQTDWLSSGLKRAASGRAGEMAPAPELRRRAAARTRRRYTVIGSGVAAMALVAGGLTLASANGGGPSPAPYVAGSASGAKAIAGPDGAVELVSSVQRQVVPPGSADESAVIGAERGFAWSLTQKLVAQSPGSDVALSGASVALALSMLELGARGETERQIAAVLGTAQLSPAAQAAGWDALTAELDRQTASGSGPHALLQIADSVFEQKGFKVSASFLDQLARYFSSGSWVVDFERDPVAATDAINAWVSEETGGRIPHLFPPGVLDASTRLVLVNAIHFKAEWAVPFTSAGHVPFHVPGGGTVAAPMITATGADQLGYAETPQATAVCVPFLGTGFQAVLIEPRAGTLPSFVSSLSSGALSALLGSLRPSGGTLTMPTFEIRYQTDISQLLSSMGMPLAFSAGADFTGINPGGGLQVTAVQHAAFLDVTAHGVDAAAATGIAVGTGGIAGGAFHLTVDHPFLFLIRDSVTGTILFSSAVENPLS